MVKVISSVPHKSVVKEVICTNCGSTLEYVPKDVQIVTINSRTRGLVNDHYIECPNCEADVSVE